MERIMAARQANQGSNPPPFMCSKRVVQSYENSFQGQKPKRINCEAEEGQSVNFNVPNYQ